jgi:uncharacterized membrane protein
MPTNRDEHTSRDAEAPSQARTERLRSLDVFRGATIAAMILVVRRHLVGFDGHALPAADLHQDLVRMLSRRWISAI